MTDVNNSHSKFQNFLIKQLYQYFIVQLIDMLFSYFHKIPYHYLAHVLTKF